MEEDFSDYDDYHEENYGEDGMYVDCAPDCCGIHALNSIHGEQPEKLLRYAYNESMAHLMDATSEPKEDYYLKNFHCPAYGQSWYWDRKPGTHGKYTHKWEECDECKKTAKKAFEDAMLRFKQGWGGVFIFSDVLYMGKTEREKPNEEKGGWGLAKLIKQQKLGHLVVTKQVVNSNSGNPIQVWMWTPNAKKVQAWCANNTKKADKKKTK